MAEDEPSINDNLLDQEIESENLPGGDDMDIDLAIENALDDLDGDLSLDDIDSPPHSASITDEEIGSLENLLEDDNEAFPTAEPAADIEDIANLSFDEDEPVSLDDDSDIPVINDVFDPKKKSNAVKAQSSAATVSDKDLLKQILTTIEEVVDEAIQAEVEKISASLKHQVNKKLKNRLTDLLKGK